MTTWSLLFALAARMEEAADPNRKRLIDRGWVPLGREYSTGVEGWGKVIDGRPVTVPMGDALEIEAKGGPL